MEQYLTAEEISQVEAKASQMQSLRQENCINIAFNPLDIMNLSTAHGLILIKGNEDTGFEHIRLRHELAVGKAYWKEENGVASLAYPSKFSPKSIPIFDYVNLADALYSATFLNIQGNKHPELFDLYDGKPVVDAAENRRYKMLLYKDTKIIHTLFPTNDKYTVKKPTGFVFEKGAVKTEEMLQSGITKISIPYLDRHREKRYTVVIENDPVKELRFIKVLIHRPGKVDLHCDYDAEPYDPNIAEGGFLQMQYQFAELPVIEKMIVDIENDKGTWSKFL